MKKFADNRAFSLIEVTIALGIAAFCLLTIFGLLPVGMNSNQASVNTTRAAGLAQIIVTDMQNTEAQGTSAIYQLTPDTAAAESKIYLKEDGAIAASPAEADYCATLTITPPAAGNAFAPTWVRVMMSWPAASKNLDNTFEVVTALDRS